MAISLDDVGPKPTPAKKKTKKKAATAAAAAGTKKTKKATKKKTAKKTRPWQASEISNLEIQPPVAQHGLPEAPAEAIQSAASAFDDGDFNAQEGPEALRGFEFADSAPRSDEARRQRRKELQEELVKEWLAVAQELKDRSLEQLPKPIASKVKNSWIGQIQLSPKVKVPVPSFLLTKIRRS